MTTVPVRLVTRSTVRRRILQGWDLERARTVPDRRYGPKPAMSGVGRKPGVHKGGNQFELDGEFKTIAEWLVDARASIHTELLLRARLRIGWTFKEALLIPKRSYT